MSRIGNYFYICLFVNKRGESDTSHIRPTYEVCQMSVESRSTDTELKKPLLSCKREILDDITSNTTNQMNNIENTAKHLPIHQNLKKQRTNLQAPKISLENLKLQNDKQQQLQKLRSFSTEDAINLAKVSAGFNPQMIPLTPISEESTIEDKIEDSNKAFKAELLQLQIQVDKHRQDAIGLRQTINELEYTNKKIKINTQKLKEELYEINSEVDELERMIYNKNSQNQQVFKLKEKESKLEYHELENELNLELYQMEKTLKHEYEEMILNYNDEIALKELQNLQMTLNDKISEHELLIASSNKELTALEQERAKHYENALKSVENPLQVVTNDIELSKDKLRELDMHVNNLQKENLQLLDNNTILSDKLNHYSKSIASGGVIIEKRLIEINDLKTQVAEKNKILNEKVSNYNESQRIHDLEFSKLTRERAKKRRILHEIYDLKGKFRCFVKLLNSSIQIEEEEYDEKYIRINKEVHKYDGIYKEENDLLKDVQILLEDSLKGISVSIIFLTNSKKDDPSTLAYTVIQKLINKLANDKTIENYELSYQHISLDKVLHSEQNDLQINSEYEKDFEKIQLIQHHQPSLLRCRLSLSNKSRNFQSFVNFVFLGNEVKQQKDLIACAIQQQQAPIVSSLMRFIYQNTKTLTIFNVDVTEQGFQKLLELGKELRNVDSPMLKRRK